jgi:glycosyltransferase involved in cell wall biosynthesis
MPEAPPDKRGAAACTLVFPAFPRVFKNHEVLVRTMRLLSDVPVKLILTFTGGENAYARKIRAEIAGLKNIELAGFLSRAELFRVYSAADAMVFPSKLETWGLPLSEFRRFNKPVFAADLPYARETLSGYQRACYFNPDDPQELGRALLRFAVNGEFLPARYDTTYAEPFARGWAETLELIGLNY